MDARSMCRIAGSAAALAAGVAAGIAGSYLMAAPIYAATVDYFMAQSRVQLVFDVLSPLAPMESLMAGIVLYLLAFLLICMVTRIWRVERSWPATGSAQGREDADGDAAGLPDVQEGTDALDGEGAGKAAPGEE